MLDTDILRGVAIAAGLGCVLGGQAVALEEKKDEKDKLKACEVSLCTLVTKKAPADGDLTCQLSKTWAKEKIKAGSASGKVSWGFGDARCSVDLKLPRTAAIDSLKAGDATLQFPEHVVSCEIEREKEVTQVKLKLAPKVVFKDGKDRAGYQRALPDLEAYYAAILPRGEDVKAIAALELEWWIVHRQRGAALPASLAALQAAIYHLPQDRFAEHARLRAEAMVLRDRLAEGAGVSDADWNRIGEMLTASWASLAAAVR